MTKRKVEQKLNRLMSDTIDTLTDTANIYAPGDKEIWNDCVKVYQRNIITLFSDLKESCINIIKNKN